MNQKVRNVCFTLNNWTEEEYRKLVESNHSYLIIGKEVGDKGTPHLQGYIEFGSQIRMGTLKKLVEKAHWEKRKGSATQASEYCKKEGDWSEWGSLSKQGKRNDLLNVKEMIDEGANDEAIADAYPVTFIKFHKGIEKIRQVKLRPRDCEPTCIWVHGKEGVGKTHYAVSQSESIYMKDASQWWDGYNQQEIIIIDDFEDGIEFRSLLRILDKYEYQGQVKGGYVQINSPFIFITCEYPPEKFWEGNKLDQILGRLDEVVEIKRPSHRSRPKRCIVKEDGQKCVIGNAVEKCGTTTFETKCLDASEVRKRQGATVSEEECGTMTKKGKCLRSGGGNTTIGLRPIDSASSLEKFELATECQTFGKKCDHRDKIAIDSPEWKFKEAPLNPSEWFE